MIDLGNKEGHERQTRPEALLALGFLGVIALGTALLALPMATKSSASIGVFDSLFTATSAVCVTGLVAVDTGTTFSLFGQIVLLMLIQVGGLGFMAFATTVMVMLGRKISLKGRMLIRESMNSASLNDLSHVTRRYLLLALGIEAVGAALLALRFIPMYGVRRGLWFSVFHAVSAFCNAGFDLFGRFSSLTAFAADPLVLLTVAILIVLGGLGFTVILEAVRNLQGRQLCHGQSWSGFSRTATAESKIQTRHLARALSLHTRIVLTATAGLLIAGTAFY